MAEYTVTLKDHTSGVEHTVMVDGCVAEVILRQMSDSRQRTYANRRD